MRKKVLSIILCIGMMFMLLPISASAETLTGEGYSFDTSTGVLTVTTNYGCLNWRSGGFLLDEVKTVVIADGVTEIGESAFNWCTNLTSVTISEGVEKILSYAFANTKLTAVRIPGSAIHFGGGIFANCDSLTTVTLGPLVPPGGIGIGVNTGGVDLFAGCNHLTTVVIEEGCEEILPMFFNNCTSLVNVSFPSTLTSINYSAFSGCSKLSSISLPDALSNIYGDAFRGCKSLTSVTIPENTTYIGEYAFNSCTNLGHVTFKGTNNVTIDTEAFLNLLPGCTFTFAPSKTFSGTGAGGVSGSGIGGAGYDFNSSTGALTVKSNEGAEEWKYDGISKGEIKSVSFESGVTKITDYTFRDCTNLTSIKIPGTVKQINGFPFLNCAQLEKIELGDGIDYLPANAFDDTKYYNDAKNWENNVLYIGSYAIKAKDTAISVKIKSGTKTLASSFAAWAKLKSVTLPESLKTIQETAFQMSDLETVTIPSGVTYIGYEAFDSCYKLREVVFEGSGALTIGDWAFAYSWWFPSHDTASENRKFYKTSASKSITGDGVPSEINLLSSSPTPKPTSKPGTGTSPSPSASPSPSGSPSPSTSPEPDPTWPENPFTDVKSSDWYHDSVKYVQEKGLMVGTSKTKFEPNATTNRGMIVTIMYRLEGEPSVEGLANFPDVPSGKWYTDAVAWAKDKGITVGNGKGNFGSGDNLTREQMATMFYRYAKMNGKADESDADLTFKDNAEISDWAEESIKWCVENGIISGRGDGILDPQGKATRAEMATIIQRFVEKMKEA